MVTKEEVMQKVSDYLGLQRAPGGELDGILTEVVAKLGVKVYSNEQDLTDMMLECGASETQVLQVRIMTRVSGFRELLESEEQTTQTDLDRYVTNAVQETGLNKDVILNITAAIALSAKLAFRYSAFQEREQMILEGEKAFVIPGAMYASELESLETEVKRRSAGPTVKNRLEVLAGIGIHGAKRILGQYYLQNTDDPEAMEVGLQFLREAATEGDSAALGYLGDYYYSLEGRSGWNDAYRCYTGYGAIALTEQRRDALTNILNQKKFNLNTIKTCCAIAILMLIAVFVAPGAVAFSACKVFGVFCFLGACAVVAVAILHYRVGPFGNFRWVLYATLGVWAIHIAARLIV